MTHRCRVFFLPRLQLSLDRGHSFQSRLISQDQFRETRKSGFSCCFTSNDCRWLSPPCKRYKPNCPLGHLHIFDLQVENMGDPWLLANQGSYNGQAISFWRCYLYLYGRVTLLDLSGMRVQTMVRNTSRRLSPCRLCNGGYYKYRFHAKSLGILVKYVQDTSREVLSLT